MFSRVLTATLLCTLVSCLILVPPSSAQCAKIKDGGILDSAGNPVSLGFDQFGYNYQAHMFNGTYDGADRTLDGTYWGQTGDYVNDKLIMKWSDDWLANQDCNGDGKLDRGLNAKIGASTGISQGWLTNHIEGDYMGSDGDQHHYTYFAKIVFDNGAACSTSQPSCIWGVYSIVEELQNDPFGEYGGKIRNRLPKPGFGLY